MILLFVVAAATFVVFFKVPTIAGETTDQLATQYVGRNPSPEAIAAVKKNLGFDQPLYTQFWTFVKGLFAGRDFKYGPDKAHCGVPCFGYSFKNHLPVWPDITSRVTVTLSLAIGAAIIWLIAGVTVGVISALRRGSVVDRLSMTIALAGVSLPIFFTGLLAKAIFVYGPSWLNLYTEIVYVPISDSPIKWAENLFLPWVTLAFLYAALYARLTRAYMLETMSEDYIRTARAKGLKEITVIRRHGLRAALTPIVTAAGLDLGGLLGGAIVSEQVFNFTGLGWNSIQAIQNTDLALIVAVVVVAAFFIVIANLVVDVLYGVIDPRVRLS